MKAHTRAVVHPGGRLGELHCTPPLTLRRVRADRADECALCLVGSAAGPLAGDELIAELALEPGARATLAATGASIAQGRGGPAASVAWRVDVGAGAHLVADPGPLIVCQGSRVDVEIALALGPDSHVEWRELLVLGRSTDAGPGAATIGWDVTRAGRPVLRQDVDLTGPAWGQLTGGHRVLAGALLSGPDVPARTVVRSRTAVAQQLDDRTVLLTVLGDRAADVTRELTALRAEFPDLLSVDGDGAPPTENRSGEAEDAGSPDERHAMSGSLAAPALPQHPALAAIAEKRAADLQLKVADGITRFAGSMMFVYVHIVIFAAWMLLFEKSPWPTLTLVVSLEAIFLSTFVMIGQNRQASYQQAKADHDFTTNEQELHTNTELTEQIHKLTQELHHQICRPDAAPSTGQ